MQYKSLERIKNFTHELLTILCVRLGGLANIYILTCTAFRQIPEEFILNCLFVFLCVFVTIMSSRTAHTLHSAVAVLIT